MHVDVRIHERQKERDKMGEIGHRTLIPEGITRVLREPCSIPSTQTDNQIRFMFTPTKCE